MVETVLGVGFLGFIGLRAYGFWGFCVWVGYEG